MDKTQKKFWLFKNHVEAGTKEGTAELILYGDIASETWWGDEVSPALFSRELSALGDISELCVRIFSGGGDVFAAQAIYSRLCDLKPKVKITVKIDGLCASAATIIAMAGDERLISEGGIFMIHNPVFGLLRNKQSSELTKLASDLDTIKKTIISSYTSKTKLSEEEISALMDAETWLDGKAAVEKGFCTGFFGETGDSGAKNSVRESIINSISTLKSVPPRLLNRLYGEDGEENLGTNKTNSKGEKKMDIKNVKDLEAAYPSLVEEVRNSAALTERQRIKALDEIKGIGNEEIVKNAMFETPKNASEVALELIKTQKTVLAKKQNDRVHDAVESGIDGVKPQADPVNDDTKDEQAMNAVLDSVFGE